MGSSREIKFYKKETFAGGVFWLTRCEFVTGFKSKTENEGALGKSAMQQLRCAGHLRGEDHA